MSNGEKSDSSNVPVETSLKSSPVLEYFQRPRSYVGFDYTADNLRQLIIGCIDPRCECQNTLKNKASTPGAGYGAGNDRQLAHMAITGNFINIQHALGDDAMQRNTSTLDVHYDCKFWKFRNAINQEMGNPSYATQMSLEEWNRRVYSKDRPKDGIFDELSESALELANTMPDGEQPEDEDLIKFIRNLYPHHKNVHTMKGANRAEGYVISHLANLGQDKKNRRDETQVYYDSLGAIIHDIKNPGNDFKKGMVPRLVGAAMMRSAATRTVIAAGSNNLVQLETRRRHKQIEVTPIDLAA